MDKKWLKALVLAIAVADGIGVWIAYERLNAPVIDRGEDDFVARVYAERPALAMADSSLLFPTAAVQASIPSHMGHADALAERDPSSAGWPQAGGESAGQTVLGRVTRPAVRFGKAEIEGEALKARASVAGLAFSHAFAQPASDPARIDTNPSESLAVGPGVSGLPRAAIDRIPEPSALAASAQAIALPEVQFGQPIDLPPQEASLTDVADKPGATAGAEQATGMQPVTDGSNPADAGDSSLPGKSGLTRG